MIESLEYPFLPVTLEIRNIHESVPAFVDTGFDGFLILPDRYLPQLGPPVTTANASSQPNSETVSL